MLQRLREAQVGGASHRTVPVGWSSTLVRRLRLERKLEGHDGCVNTVHFSPCGDLLVSGSDDLQIIFWDWQLGLQRLQFNSGHHNNVFQARIMPQSANGTVVSCAADGAVRVAHIPQGAGGAAVETRRLACHRGRAHKLALEPGSSAHCFLSCGEDGEVRHFDLREPGAANRRLLACRTQRGRLELNSVHCHPGNSQFCVAGGDPFVRVYDLRRVGSSSSAPVAEPVRRLAPWHLRSRRSLITITCAVFSQGGEVLATYNDENIYLFEAEEPATGRSGSGSRAQQGGQGQRHAAGGEAGGSSSGRQGNKRLRSSGSGNGNGSSGTSPGTDDGRQRSQQRRAAAAAALAQAHSQRAASGAAAAAQAHASMRRGIEAESEGDGAGPSTAAAGVAERAGQQPSAPPAGTAMLCDASWLDRLPPPRQQQDEQQPAGAMQLSGPSQQGGREAAAAAGAARAGGGGGQAGAAGTRGDGSPSRGDSGSSGSRGGSQGSGGESSPAYASGGSSSDTSSSSSLGSEGEEGASGSDSEPEGSGFETDVSAGDVEEGDEEAEDDEDDDEEDEEDEEDDFDYDIDEEEPPELPEGALVDDADTAVPGMQAAGAGGGSIAEQGEHPSDSVLQVFKGHRNYRTVKGVSFLGQHDEFVMSGSDCGHVFVWGTRTGTVLAMLKGDHDTVNCLEPHPHHLLTIATSGIEDSIKLWTPTAEEPQVIGAAEERRMAVNQREQGQERRMFISPEMLQILLRARQFGGGGGSEEGSEGEDSGEEGVEGHRRRPGDCTIA